MSYPITAEMLFNAIQQGAREATLESIKNIDFSTAQGQAQAKAGLDAIEGKDFATQETLAQVLARLETIENQLDTGDAKVQLKGHIEEYAVKSWGDLPPDSVPAGSVAMLIGTDDIRQSDGAEWVVLA